MEVFIFFKKLLAYTNFHGKKVPKPPKDSTFLPYTFKE